MSHVPQIVTYIDGPFYADEALPVKQQKQMLRNQLYKMMCRRAKENTVELIRYVVEDSDIIGEDGFCFEFVL